VGSIGLGLLLLLVVPRQLAAEDDALRLFPASETVSSTRSLPAYRLLPEDSGADRGWGVPLSDGLGSHPPPVNTPTWTLPYSMHELLTADASERERRMALADPAKDTPPPVESDLPRSEFLERHQRLFSILIPVASVGGVMANSLVGYTKNQSFEFHKEGFFGHNTTNGGADKASHMTDYFVITNLFTDVYRILGYSELEATLWGFGIAVATGAANEFSDGYTRHGFSWEDLVMDTAGAMAASIVSLTHTQDLFGMRTSHVPGTFYDNDVYAADLKLSGAGQRLGIPIGPLRWLLLSGTYSTKGYRANPPKEEQRLVGIEIGLNFQQILNDVGVKKNTWWGYGLHLFADNIRFPYTAVGFRYDINHGKWHGPNSGNYD
jgi:uncharacterized protein YfiM (DUF2279 family)